MLVVFWICNPLKAVDVIRGQFFSRIHCKVHLLAGEVTGFPVNPKTRGVMSSSSDFGVWVVFLIIAGTFRTLLARSSILSWVCLQVSLGKVHFLVAVASLG